ncbi:MAG: cohesin domain-containing protein [Luteolibacter sp.]
MKSLSILLRRWLARLVIFVLKNQKIEPQMNGMNADGQSENYRLYLCSSSAFIWVYLRLKILKLATSGVLPEAVECGRRDASTTVWRETRQPLILAQAAGTLLLALIAPTTARADSRNFSLPSYLANPGGVLEVPLTLDNAAGLAAIQAQINFDPEVLELLTVTSGPLGEAFELSQGDGDGFVQLTFVRAEALAGGAGRLAVLKFRANPGAVTDLFSDLAIADLSLSDSTGVIDLQQKDALTTLNGAVTVTLQPNIDNARSGLPDWWEMQHELDLFTANAGLDPEQDGMSNLLEYAFGGNPRVADAHQRRIQSERVVANGKTYLSIGFHRRVGDSTLHFRVQESPDLQTWNHLSLPQQLIGTPQNLGDGTEFVKVLGTIPATGANAQPHGFMRVVVDKAE